MKRVVDYFPFLTQAQVTQLPDALQLRWSELQSNTHAGRRGPIEVGHEAAVLERAQADQLIQRWRVELKSYSPLQLLQRWLDEAAAEAVGNFFADEDTKKLYLEAQRRHFETFHPKRLYLKVRSDPIFRLLCEKFPTSTVWAALEAWDGQGVPYLSAFCDIAYQVQTIVGLALDEEGINDSNLSVFITKCKKERLYAVLISCDLLARSFAELPGNTRWISLIADLENLRVRVNLELSSLTKCARKGGLSTANLIEQIWGDPQDHSGLTQGSRKFLTELVKFLSVQDSLAIALAELESTI